MHGTTDLVCHLLSLIIYIFPSIDGWTDFFYSKLNPCVLICPLVCIRAQAQVPSCRDALVCSFCVSILSSEDNCDNSVPYEGISDAAQERFAFIKASDLCHSDVTLILAVHLTENAASNIPCVTCVPAL